MKKQASPSLSDALEEITIRRRGPRCGMSVILDDLKAQDPKGHDLLLGMIDNVRIPTTSIAEALVAAGFTVQKDQVSRHRRRGSGRGCACPK